MRDCSKDRAGFDRVLMAVAATFLTVSATSALAQADAPRSSAAELAIEAAIPRPEPANVPPPTASDFKLDTTTTGAVPRSRRTTVEPQPTDAPSRSQPKPATAPAARADACCRWRPRSTAAATPARRLRPPPRRAPPPSRSRPQAPFRQPISRSPTNCAKCWARRSLRYFDRKNERAAVEKFYTVARICAGLDPGRQPDRTRQGRDRAAEGCRLRRPQCRRLSGAGFRRRDHAGRAGRRRTEADRQHAGLCAPGAERPDALVAGRRRHPLSRTSDRPGGSAGQRHGRQGRLRGARGLQPAAQALQGIEGQARRIARPGRRTGGHDRRRPGAGVQGRPPRSSRRWRRKIRACRSCAPSSASPKIPTTPITTPSVAAAVRKFQESAELKATGVLDDKTVKAINSPKRDRQIDTVLVNMERWRWLPRQLGAPSLEQRLCHPQHPRFHAEGDAGRRAGLDHPRRDRQAGQTTPRRC